MAITMDSILKLPTPKKVLILLAILCALGVLYYNSLFLPLQDELKTLKSELNKLVMESNESRAIARDLQKFKDLVEKLNVELKNALTQLPSEKEIPEILKNISGLGKESNLEFILFRPKLEEPLQFYSKVPIELTLVGSYHNIGIFFDKVSKLPRIINVVDFNMTRAKDIKGREAKDEVLVKTSCMLNTYRFIEKKGEEKKGEKKGVSKETGEGIPKAKE